MSHTLTESRAVQPGSRVRAPHRRLDDIDKATVADLPRAQIREMTRDELACVIRAAEMPILRGDAAERLKLFDREILERLAYLARYCCRNQGY